MYAIKAASDLSGVNPETIRYYERIGVVGRPGRTGSGRRSYTTAEVARLRFVRRCRALGLPLEGIRELLDLDRGASCGLVRAAAARHAGNVRSRIGELHDMLARLEALVARCDSGEDHCPALAALFADGDAHGAF